MPTRLEELHRGFTTVDRACAPMVRWWWFGPRVERAWVDRDLAAVAEGGYGGVELAVVYPMSEETGRYLSPEFCSLVRYAAERARAHGLRFDLTLGSGWSYGGPHVDATTAARCLSWDRREVDPVARRLPAAGSWPEDRFVAAYVGEGTLQEPPRRYQRLAVEDGLVVLPAGAGPRVVLTATSRPTGQQVKRAAAGAEGSVLDHYSETALRAHLAAVADPLLDAVPAGLVECVFCDSLEVYGADWTEALPEDFQTRRGEDLLDSLWLLTTDGEEAAALRAGYYRTLSELYEERFAAPLRAWAEQRGVELRLQGYGEPPAAVSSTRHVHRVEGEGWGWTGLPQTRWASSGAALRQAAGEEPVPGAPVSTEIWTWVHSPSFRATPLDLLGELHEHLLLGATHVVGHGWPCSPRDGDGLGWVFYAAGALDDRNPWWPATARLTAYAARLCGLLQQGRRVADVLVHVPDRDAYARLGAGRPAGRDLWKATRDHLGPDVPRVVRTSGYDFDLADDSWLAALEPGARPVVLLPEARHVTEGAAGWLRRARAAGSLVLWVGDGPLPEALAGVAEPVTVGALGETLRGTLPPPLALDPAEAGAQVGTVHYRVGEAEVFLLANTGPQPARLTGTPRTGRAVLELWDPETGEVRWRGAGGGSVALELQPYEAALLVAAEEPSAAAVSEPLPPAGATGEVVLDGPWTVQLPGGPEQPVRLPHRWEDDPALTGYAGPATYRTTVTLAGRSPVAELDLGAAQPAVAGDAGEEGIRGRSYRAEVTAPVGVVAEVAVDGEPRGLAWRTPYRVNLGPLEPGEHVVTVTVRNTAAGALAGDEELREAQRRSHARYGRRFQIQDLDRARDGLASGLLARPVLRW